MPSRLSTMLAIPTFPDRLCCNRTRRTWTLRHPAVTSRFLERRSRRIAAVAARVAAPDVMTVSPDDTGISHFVLPGFIPKTLLGEMDKGWKLVTHDQSDTESPDIEAPLAACNVHRVRRHRFFQSLPLHTSADQTWLIGLSVRLTACCLQRQHHHPRIRNAARCVCVCSMCD